MKKIVSLVLSLFIIGSVTITSRAAGLTSIDSTTFRRDYMATTVHIGSEVEEITSTAFKNMMYLREITVSENNPYYSSYSGCLYDKGQTELLRFPPSLSGAYIPATVTEIGDYALYGVPDKLKEQVTAVINEQALGNLSEEDIPGAHFVHTENGVRWVMENGEVVIPTSTVMSLAADVVNLSSTKDMTQPKQLEAAFNYIAQNVAYVRSMEVPTGDWVQSYAANTLGTKSGNCYGYAAAFAYIARGLGYESKVCVGTVESALGGRTAHAWTEVKMGSNWYIFDTEMQAAKGSGYYKQTADKYPAGPIIKTGSWTVNY